MKIRNPLKICRDIVREFSPIDIRKRGDPRILINYLKTMNHNCDVINLNFKKGAQKLLTESHLKTAMEKCFLMSFSA